MHYIEHGETGAAGNADSETNDMMPRLLKDSLQERSQPSTREQDAQKIFTDLTVSELPEPPLPSQPWDQDSLKPLHTKFMKIKDDRQW